MKWMNKAFEWCGVNLPALWGLLWISIITIASVSGFILVLKWFFQIILSF